MSKSSYSKSLLAVAVVSATMFGQTAVAYEGGDIIVRSGIAAVNPVESSTIINIETLNLGNAGNSNVALDSEKQLGITASYLINNKFGIELLAATPFSHHILGAGSLNGAGKLGKTKHLPPTLSAHYYLNDAKSSFQPYVGVGINYTTFFDTSASPTLDNAGTFQALVDLAGGPAGAITSASNTDIELEDSFGLSIQLGFDLALNRVNFF